MNITFDNKVVVITGAAHGFGRAIALAFAEHGAHVWICDVLPDKLEETCLLCVEANGQCEARVVNVRDRDAVFGFVDEVLSQHSSVDILVNNAGGVLGQVMQARAMSPRLRTTYKLEMPAKLMALDTISKFQS